MSLAGAAIRGRLSACRARGDRMAIRSDRGSGTVLAGGSRLRLAFGKIGFGVRSGAVRRVRGGVAEHERIRRCLPTFRGVRRRFSAGYRIHLAKRPVRKAIGREPLGRDASDTITRYRGPRCDRDQSDCRHNQCLSQ